MIYLKLFLEFFRIGLVTFGGGLAMIPLIQDAVCKKNEWLTEEEMVDCIAVTQSMPGIIAVNVATYVGGKKKGILGAACATTGVVLPGFLILVLVFFVSNAGDNRFVQGAMVGIKGASAGLILLTTINMGKKIIKNLFTWLVAIGAFVLIIGLDINAVIPILASAFIGIITVSLANRKKGTGMKGGE